MIINTNVPKSVYEKLQKGQIVQAQTNFGNSYSPKAYKLLSRVSGMDNFFFGIAPASECQEDLYIHLTESDSKNDTILTLEIPQSELFIHDFYGFSGLIYDCEDYDNLKLSDETLWEYAQKLYLINKHSSVQVIYKEIHPEWIIKAESSKTFEQHDTQETLNAQAQWKKETIFNA